MDNLFEAFRKAREGKRRRRLRHMSRLYRAGQTGWPAINASVQSWIGHARHAETDALRATIFNKVSFNRGAGRCEASA